VQTGVKVIIYSQMFCGYCSAARSLLEKKGVSYEEVDITMNPQVRRELQQRTGRHTVPQIFIGDRHVGGYDDMAALDAAGELDPLLAGGS
jgi:glutaredoxin 3